MRILVAIAVSIYCLGSSAQTMMFSANPLKEKQILAFVGSQYYTNDQKYDWTSGDWQSLSGNKEVTNVRIIPMLGYGITSRLALYLQFPSYIQNKDDQSTTYPGDMLSMFRYNILKASSKKTGLTLLGGARFPTAEHIENPFADGNVEVFLGEIFSTKYYGRWRTHIKSTYFISPDNAYHENPGDQLQVVAKQDFKMGSFKLYGSQQFVYVSAREDKNEQMVAHSEKYRLIHLLGLNYFFNKHLWLESKFLFPSWAKGGSLYHEKFIFNLVYKFNGFVNA